MAPPGEPCADLDGDGTCAPGEPFLRLAYPVDPLAAGAGFTRVGLLATSAAQSPIVRGPEAPAALTYAGVIVLAGRLDASRAARVNGAVAAGGALRLPAAPGHEPVQVLYDERLGRGLWPTPDTRMPRTVWSARSVGP